MSNLDDEVRLTLFLQGVKGMTPDVQPLLLRLAQDKRDAASSGSATITKETI